MVRRRILIDFPDTQPSQHPQPTSKHGKRQNHNVPSLSALKMQFKRLRSSTRKMKKPEYAMVERELKGPAAYVIGWLEGLVDGIAKGMVS
jgi:hypothetical protein